MYLIEYINIVFDDLLSKRNMNRISTFVQLCFGHLSKTFAKDVDLYFPDLSSSKQAILQEVFAGMCNCSSLTELRDIWKNLSTLLFSKFANHSVHGALTNLATTMTKPFEKEIPLDRLPMDVFNTKKEKG